MSNNFEVEAIEEVRAAQAEAYVPPRVSSEIIRDPRVGLLSKPNHGARLGI